MAISDAVGLDRISRIVGYKLTKGFFQDSTPNLPQRIAILGEANTANQGTLDTTPIEVTSARQAGELFGYGSPIYNMMRILRPVNSDGVGGIPTVVYPQEEAVGATAAARTITPSGTATGNTTHTIVINGRRNVDAVRYDFTIANGDNVAAITAKITDAINNVLGSPVDAVDNSTDIECTTKWAGLTSEGLDITIDNNGNAFGITYAVVSSSTGAGTPDISSSLALFGSNWNTIVVNSYDEVVLDNLEAFNGIPDPTVPSGRYVGVIMKPFIALYGDVSDDPSTVTDLRKTQVTNAVCPAPRSKGWRMEAAANMCVLFARVTQDTPHLSTNGLSYPDMPVPSDGVIGDMANYNFRDSIVKKGSSTVDLVAERYQVQDFVTTYHPLGEEPPQYRYCRNLMLDFNVRYTYYLLEQINVVDKAIANDDDIVRVNNVVKPKQWIAIVSSLADDLSERALIADAQFMKDSIVVGISTFNPDRLETFFKYKRTGVVRISSTTAEAGFNFGQV
ncbi:MAG: hypothetical protein ACPGSO_00610 [Vicingaceae bacterium]